MRGASGQALLPLARSPSEWADAQRAFAGSVGDDVPGEEVWVRWWSHQLSPSLKDSPPARLLRLLWFASLGNAAIYRLVVAAGDGVVVAIRRLRGGPVGAYVMVFRAGEHGPSGPELLLCEVRPTDLPSPAGSSRAVLVGELARNGALAIEIDDRRIFPTYNPRAPSVEHLRASRRFDPQG